MTGVGLLCNDPVALVIYKCQQLTTAAAPSRSTTRPLTRGTIWSASASHSTASKTGRSRHGPHAGLYLILASGHHHSVLSINSDALIGRNHRSQRGSKRWWTYRRRSIVPCRCQKQGTLKELPNTYLQSTYRLEVCGSASPDFPLRSIRSAHRRPRHGGLIGGETLNLAPSPPMALLC